ncbi:hypothetical protein MHU86_16907 [Fragilaria crotonensis]|nr:hypothetical protein MHU86_16907 [Fragilaria crotonensis]
MAPATPVRTFKVKALFFGLCALAILNTNLMSASRRALSETTRRLCKTVFNYPDWKQYWEDLFAPKSQYASTGVRSLIPLQKNNIGYFLTLASCPADGYPAADSYDPGHAFYDAAAVLKYSIFSNTYPAKSKYNATMYAVVHPAAVVCKGPNHEPYDRVKVLQDLGYTVTILGSPVIKANMKGYVKNNIDSDAGDRDFMRIQVSTLITTQLSKISFTYDYPDILPNTGKNSGMSSHFIIAKPSPEFFKKLADAYVNAIFSPTMGWNWQGIKDFKGVLGMKGFFIHYFTRVETGVSDVLSRCVFGNDASNPRATDPSGKVVCRDPLDCKDCRTFDFKSMRVIKLIDTCGKPWECAYKDSWDSTTKKACEGFHRAWFSARVDFEESCWKNGPPSFRNGAYKPDVFLGFCACSGITCYDRMIDDKSAPSVCDKDTQTNSKVGRITFPSGAFQDQQLSLTTGQVTGSPTACLSGKISLAGFDAPYNLGIVVDTSGSTCGKFAGTLVGDLDEDGKANTILDAEIASIVSLLETIAATPDLGNDNVSIGLIEFSTGAEHLGIYSPCEANDQRKVNTLLLKKLKTLRCGGFTSFDDGLDKSIEYFKNAPKDRNNFLLFLSDGDPVATGDKDREETDNGDGKDSGDDDDDDDDGDDDDDDDDNDNESSGGESTGDDDDDDDDSEGTTTEKEDRRLDLTSYASKLSTLDSFKVKRISIGIGADSDVREGYGLALIDNTPNPLNKNGPVLATTTDALKAALLNNPIGGVLLDFKVSVNGAVQNNIDESHVKAGPSGFSFGRFVVSGLDPRHGVINEITATAVIDYDGLPSTTKDQVILTTSNMVPGTLL